MYSTINNPVAWDTTEVIIPSVGSEKATSNFQLYNLDSELQDVFIKLSSQNTKWDFNCKMGNELLLGDKINIGEQVTTKISGYDSQDNSAGISALGRNVYGV